MGRLKGISTLLSPDLLHALASMGHGDEIVLGDSNFPTSSLCCHNGPLEIRSDGHGIPDLLEAILSIFPIDTYDNDPINVMDLTDSDKAKGMKAPGVWSKYEALIEKAEGRKVALTRMERFSFYEKAKTAFAIVHTGELAAYGNIILKKGVVMD